MIVFVRTNKGVHETLGDTRWSGVRIPASPSAPFILKKWEEKE